MHLDENTSWVAPDERLEKEAGILISNVIFYCLQLYEITEHLTRGHRYGVFKCDRIFTLHHQLANWTVAVYLLQLQVQYHRPLDRSRANTNLMIQAATEHTYSV